MDLSRKAKEIGLYWAELTTQNEAVTNDLKRSGEALNRQHREWQ
jgi:hypothetical protein